MAKRTQFHRKPRHVAALKAAVVAWESGVSARSLPDAVRYGARADLVRSDYGRPNRAAARRAARAMRAARVLSAAYAALSTWDDSVPPAL